MLRKSLNFFRPTINVRGYKAIPTLPDGNCAFNALALGLRDILVKALDNEIAQVAESASMASVFDPLLQAFNAETDSHLTLSEFIYHLETSSDDQVQRELSPVLREMACDLCYASEVAESSQTSMPTGMEGQLLSEMENALRVYLGMPMLEGNIEDDFFHRQEAKVTYNMILAHARQLKASYLDKIPHNNFFEKITRDFKLYPQHRLREIFGRELAINDVEEVIGIEKENPTLLKQHKEALLAEWRASGCHIFFDSMKQEGAWGGDLELAVLAKLFKVNLTVSTPRMVNGTRSVENQGAHTIRLHNSGAHWTYLQEREKILSISQGPKAKNVGKQDVDVAFKLEVRDEYIQEKNIILQELKRKQKQNLFLKLINEVLGTFEELEGEARFLQRRIQTLNQELEKAGYQDEVPFVPKKMAATVPTVPCDTLPESNGPKAVDNFVPDEPLDRPRTAQEIEDLRAIAPDPQFSQARESFLAQFGIKEAQDVAEKTAEKTSPRGSPRL